MHLVGESTVAVQGVSASEGLCEPVRGLVNRTHQGILQEFWGPLQRQQQSPAWARAMLLSPQLQPQSLAVWLCLGACLTMNLSQVCCWETDEPRIRGQRSLALWLLQSEIILESH